MTVHTISDLTSTQIRERLETAPVLLVPVGATEQHGPNLGCGVDWRIADELAKRIADRVDPLALVAPAFPLGLSAHHLDFPGTLHLRPETFMAVFTDLVTSYARHGVEKVVFINGHRGNENILGVLTTKLTFELGIQTASAFWMRQAADVIARHRKTDRWGHACEIETSLALALVPEIVDTEHLEAGDLIEDYLPYEDNYQQHALQVPRTFASRTRNGVFGDARVASRHAGEDIAEATVSRTAEFVRAFAQRPGVSRN
ncbi:MAG: creatininase family protein [Haloechinothrix sp.]